MPGDPSPEGKGADLTPAAVASAVEDLAKQLSEVLGGISDEDSRRRLEQLLAGVRQVSSSLHSMALLFDPERADALAQREGELRKLVQEMTQSIRELAVTNRRLAQETGDQVRELEAITELPPGEEFTERLSAAVGRVRQVAEEMDGHVETTAASVEQANQRIAELERQLEEARKRVLTDPLTRVHSRAALGEHLQQAVRDSAPGAPWCFMLADIDHFKAINDRFGHLVGDAVLYKVARLIEGALKGIPQERFLARYGGEEFAVVLKDADLGEAGRIADHVRKTVGASRWEYRGHPDHPVVQVTISMGVAQHHGDDTSPSLVQRADDALYKAKNAGRNRVVVARV
jgi:diguanylate cyclase